MHTPAEIGKAVFGQLRTELAPWGFRPRRRFLLRDRSVEVTDWLALAWAIDVPGGPVQVHVNVGVHCSPLHHLEAELRGAEYQPTTATFAVNLGYLGPEREWRAWTLLREPVPQAVTAEMVDVISRYAVPFWAQYSDLRSVTDGCRRHGLAIYNTLRLPVLQYLQGDRIAARELLMVELTACQHEDHPAADEFRRAAARLLDLLDEGGTAPGAA